MYLDTDVLYATIDTKDPHAKMAQKIINMKEEKYSSVATLIELEFVIRREISDDASKNVLEPLRELNIKFKDIDLKIFELSLDLRREYDLTIMDSLHAACALLNDKRIASTDSAYDRIIELRRIF